MYTFQDLEAVGKEDSAKGKFIRACVNHFKTTKEYQEAVIGETYYNKHNITIEQFQKFLYTLSGEKVADVFSANYKIKTLFFRRLVIQQVQYVLGNGVTLQNEGNKEKLGKDFDFKLQTCAKRAMASGRAFGFWNLDHLEVFSYVDTPSQAGFCPLYDEKTSELRAGIRFWFRLIDSKWIFRATLYEEDGYTEYIQNDNDDVQVLEPKRGYKRNIIKTVAGGVESVIDENYTTLPIRCLFANDSHESELVGIRESIDCYDFIKSGLANDIDDTAGFYWILKNTGGMDDVDLAQFIQRMKTVKASVVDGDSDATAEAHTLDIPVEARKTMLELLRKDIYEDFQSLDVNTLSASAKTTQEIQSAYQSQDNKCADFEYYILEFVQAILELAGINDTPSLVWNRVVNQNEQTDMVLKASQYLTDEIIIKKLPFLTPEEADQVIAQREQESYEQFNSEASEEDLEDDGENIEGESENQSEGISEGENDVLKMLDELIAELEG